MTFSNEPMICIYGEFACDLRTTCLSPRREQLVHRTGQPVDDPFGYDT